MTMQPERPAYREPWFWMVFAPLIVVVMASFGFMYVAFVGADDRVYDDYYKQGRMINKQFAAETRAQALQLKGEAQFDFAAGEVLLTLEGKQVPGELQLQISHPAQRRKDAALTLTRIGESMYRGELPQTFSGHRYLILSAGAEDSLWRITAEANFDQSVVVDFVPHL